MADYGGQDTTARSHKADELSNINEPKMGTPSITIDRAMDLIVSDVKAGKPNHLVPGACESNHPTEKAQPGRPVLDPALMGGCKGDGKAPPPAPAGSGSGSGSAAAGSGSGSGAACDEVSCVLDNYAGACCAKFRAANGAGSGSGSAKNPKAGAGSGDNGANIRTHSTGSPADTHAVGGAGGAPTTGHANGSAALAPGGHAP